MLLGQFELLTSERAPEVLENSPDAECLIEHTGRLLLPDYLLSRLASCQPPFLFRLAIGRNAVYLGYPVFRSFRANRQQNAFGRNCVLVPSWAAEQLALPSDSAALQRRNDWMGTSTESSSCSAVAAQPVRVSLFIEVLPTGSFIRLKPLQPKDVSSWANPAATLNKKLRDFACLSVGAVFSILYLERTFYFEIKSLKPAPAVCVIDCDMHLEFDFDPTPDDPATADAADVPLDEDAVLSDERLRRCGVTGPAQANDLLRDALTRARTAADASARRWGAGVALATGQEVVAAPAVGGVADASSAPAPVGQVRPNLRYEWGSLNFTRPAGRPPVPSSNAPEAAAANASSAGSGGRGVRLKDNL